MPGLATILTLGVLALAGSPGSLASPGALVLRTWTGL
jgi:hypothetical protein